MKKGVILLTITIILIAVCGCTQTSTPVQPNATTPPQTTQQLTITTVPVSQTTATVSANTIQIKNFAFNPANITIKVGSTVRWYNKDSVPHRLMFTDGTYSQVLAGMDTWSRKIDRAGTYDYVCTIHPDMHGTVIVE